MPEPVIDRILEAVRLAPSSSGLQPYELVLVTNPEVKERLVAAANGQRQVADASHLIVFAAWDTYTAERIDRWFDLVNEERGTKSEGWENYRKFLLGSYPERSAEVNHHHAAKQAYLALGVALVACAVEGVDSTPMEGFDPDAVDAILGLRARGLRSVVLLPVGHRDAEKDWLAPLKKVRKSRAALVTEVR